MVTRLAIPQGRRKCAKQSFERGVPKRSLGTSGNPHEGGNTSTESCVALDETTPAPPYEGGEVVARDTEFATSVAQLGSNELISTERDDDN
jgi:hypothetical protein